MKCLLVDDEPGIREGLAMLLRRKGHEVTTASDCAAAALALQSEQFAVVISDWRLPDGFASSFLHACGCPVVAISGHPEEVERAVMVQVVLQKPVMPTRLLEVLAELSAKREVRVDPSLPRDVAALVTAALQILGRPEAACVQDDGSYVVLTAALPDDARLERLGDLGGDLRVLTPHGQPRVELRWCRDGRPELTMLVCRPGDAWPEAGEFAVDLHAVPHDESSFAGCLDRAVACQSRGGRVHFLNVPEPMQIWATSQGRAHDMPMREKVGPRLPAVLAELWSEP